MTSAPPAPEAALTSPEVTVDFSNFLSFALCPRVVKTGLMETARLGSARQQNAAQALFGKPGRTVPQVVRVGLSGVARNVPVVVPQWDGALL